MGRGKACQRLVLLSPGILLTISINSTLDWSWIHFRRFWPRPKELPYPCSQPWQVTAHTSQQPKV